MESGIVTGPRSGTWRAYWFIGLVVGLLVALLDLAEMALETYPVFPDLGDSIQVLGLSLLVMGQFGGLVGLLLGGLVESGRFLPVPGPLRRIRADGWTRRDRVAVAAALVGAAMAAMAAMMLYLEFGAGRLMRPAPLALCVFAGLMVGGGLAWTGLASKHALVQGFVFALSWSLGYLVVDRVVAPFSQQDPVRLVHWVMVMGVVALGQAMVMTVSESKAAEPERARWRDSEAGRNVWSGSLGSGGSGWWSRFRGHWRKGASVGRRTVAGCTWLLVAGAWVATAGWLRMGNNQTRLFVFDRTAFVFRPALLMEQTTFLGRRCRRNVDRLVSLCPGREVVGEHRGLSAGKSGPAGRLGRPGTVGGAGGPGGEGPGNRSGNDSLVTQQTGTGEGGGCGCGGTDRVVRSADSDLGSWPVRGVVFIMVDALRADMLFARRSGRRLTPNIGALAFRSLFFDRAHSVVPATNAAVGGMLTGRYSLLYDRRFLERWSVLGILARQGVWTGAIVSHRHCRYIFDGLDMVDLSLDVVGLPEGANALTSAQVTSRALAVVRSIPAGRRFFLFVHYYDPHEHYVQNPMFRFGWSDRARYEAEVAYTDFWIGRFLSQLRRGGPWSNVAVVLVGDHGDALWEHRSVRHRFHLYEEVTRVPMLLHLPGQVRGLRISRPVSTLSLAATLLGLFGSKDKEQRAVSLMELAGLTHRVPSGLDGGRSTPGAARRQDTFMLSADRRLWALLSGYRKVIFNEQTGVVESYDLASDPEERRNEADLDEVGTCLLLRRLLVWRRAMLTGRSLVGLDIPSGGSQRDPGHPL